MYKACTLEEYISILAPARGATGKNPAKIPSKTISILAPARGATGAGKTPAPCADDFNSRPCERGDPTSSAAMCPPCIFQFSPLREGRHEDESRRQEMRYFNSRPCERGDSKNS